MRRELIAAALALLGTPVLACSLVFGQGRNPTEPGEEAPWDRLNQRFNEKTVATLSAGGRQVYAVMGSTEEIDPAASSELLLQMARERRCYTLIETTVFHDTQAQTLVARLRVYPLLSAFDGSETGLRVGAPVYVNERERSWSDRALVGFKPEAIAAEMASDYLKRSGKR